MERLLHLRYLQQAATGCNRLQQAAIGCNNCNRAATGCNRTATGCNTCNRAATGRRARRGLEAAPCARRGCSGNSCNRAATGCNRLQQGCNRLQQGCNTCNRLAGGVPKASVEVRSGGFGVAAVAGWKAHVPDDGSCSWGARARLLLGSTFSGASSSLGDADCLPVLRNSMRLENLMELLRCSLGAAQNRLLQSARRSCGAFSGPF